MAHDEVAVIRAQLVEVLFLQLVQILASNLRGGLHYFCFADVAVEAQRGLALCTKSQLMALLGLNPVQPGTKLPVSLGLSKLQLSHLVCEVELTTMTATAIIIII